MDSCFDAPAADPLVVQAAEYRGKARAELAKMQASSLPPVREKHRTAAEQWLRMALNSERLAAQLQTSRA